jgi:ankyrin repeat protein
MLRLLTKMATLHCTGLLQMVKYLVEKGADADTVNNAGNTHLHWATENGHWHVEKYLKEKAAHISS